MEIPAIKESFSGRLSYVLSFLVSDFKSFLKVAKFEEVHSGKVVIRAPQSSSIFFKHLAFKDGEIIEGSLIFEEINTDIIVSGSKSAIYETIFSKKDSDIIYISFEYLK